MRLIDADVAEKMLRKYADDVGCKRGEIELANGILKAVGFIRHDIPTAFDTEKVLEELRNGANYHYGDLIIDLEDAKAIVKKGGIEC